MTRHDIPGWFPSHNEAALLALIQTLDIKTVIEVGSFLGKSAAFFAEHCESVVCIDPFVMWKEGFENGDAVAWAGGNDFFHKFWFNMTALKLQDKITPVRCSSAEAAHLLPTLRADLIYIDGAHDENSVLNDITLWLPRANKVICGDDYSEHWDSVRRAVSNFAPVQVAGDSIWIKKV